MKGVSIYRIPRTEQVYTFKNDQTGVIHHFAVDQMNAYIQAAGLEPKPIEIHPDLIRHLVERGGWEKAHLDQMSDEAMKTPCTLIEYDEQTHVLADGVHRVLRHVQRFRPTFLAYLVPERIWSRFLIYDFPEWVTDWDDFLVNGDRHHGLDEKRRKKVRW